MRGPILPILLVLASACGGMSGSGSGADSTCPIAAVPATPTFRGHILPALQESCGSSTTSCHGNLPPPIPPAGHVEYDTASGRTATDVYNDLVNAPPANAPAGFLRVKPYDVAHSWIIEKITKDSPGGAAGTYGARMPYAAADVCQPTVDAFDGWINRGAPND